LANFGLRLPMIVGGVAATVIATLSISFFFNVAENSRSESAN
jgi:hypothetical protein